MKKIFLLLLAAMTVNTFAETLTYEMVMSSNKPKKELDRKYDAYTASDGHTYKVGDHIVMGTPTNKTFTYMTSQLGQAYAVIFNDMVPDIHAHYAGSKMKITDIRVERHRKRGAMVVVRAYLAGLGGVLLQFENCLATGEIVSQGMSRDKALDEIKRAKEMLELDLITQQEYDSIKAVCKEFLK